MSAHFAEEVKMTEEMSSGLRGNEESLENILRFYYFIKVMNNV